MTNSDGTIELSRVATVVPGTSPAGRDISENASGLPFYQGSKEFGFLYPLPERYTEKPVKVAKEGDILLSVRAPVGKVNLTPTDCAIGRGVMAVRPRDARDRDYLALALEDMGSRWEAHSTDGTMFANLSRSGLEMAVIPWPTDRHRIAKVITTLGRRILAMERLEKTLAETVLTECEAVIESRASTETMPLTDAVRLVNGGAYTKGASGTGRMVVRIKELNSGPSDSTVYNDIAVPTEKTVYPGDVLFAWSGSLGVWRWYRDEAIVNQHIFKVLKSAHPVWLGWVHILRELDDFRDIAAGKATTMGHITRDHLERARVPELSSAELADLSSRVEPLWQFQLRVGREVQSLFALRAFLLPRLISGELRVESEHDSDERRA